MSQKDLLDYYIKHADKRFDEIEKKVDKLISFRWMLIGASVSVSGIISIAIQLLDIFYKGQK